MREHSTVVLSRGAHVVPEDGMCAMEAVAWLAGEAHSDVPACASPVISAYVRHLNDSMPADQRQRLLDFLPRIVGSLDPTREHARTEVFAWAAIQKFAPAALRSAGMHKHAAELAAFSGTLAEAGVLAYNVNVAISISITAVSKAARDTLSCTEASKLYSTVSTLTDAGAALYSAASVIRELCNASFAANESAYAACAAAAWDLALATLSDALDVNA